MCDAVFVKKVELGAPNLADNKELGDNPDGRESIAVVGVLELGLRPRLRSHDAGDLVGSGLMNPAGTRPGSLDSV